MKSRSFKQQPRSQGGAFFVLLALALVAILSVLFLVVDAARLQRTRVLLQRILDASALAVTYMFDEQVDGRLLSADELREIARQLVNDNLRASGLEAIAPGPQISLQFSGSGSGSQPRKIQISAAVAPELLINALPGLGNSVDIGASSEAGNRRVAVSLVLDRSGSMDDRTNFCSNGAGRCKKIEELRRAAWAFVNELTPDDRLAIVSFADGATVDFPMQRVPEDKSALNRLINGPDTPLVATGWTSTYLGLEQGANQLSSSLNNDLMDHDLKALILVTDGAPRGPNSDLDDPRPPTPDAVGINCNTVLGPTATDKRQQRRYIRPIQIGDQLRNSGVVIYTVGLGGVPIPAIGATDRCPHDLPFGATYYNPLDPYQCADYDMHVKNHFLARVANDQTSMRGSPMATPPIPVHPDFPFDCVPSKDSLGGTRGAFYQTPRASELRAILVNIAKNIKMRLYQ